MILQTELFGSPLQAWLTALGIALSINVVIGAIKWLAVKRIAAIAARTSTSIDDALVQAIQRTRQTLVFLVTLYIGSRYLDALPSNVDATLRTVATLSAFLQIGLWFSAMLEFWLNRSRARALQSDGGAATTLGVMRFVGMLVLWSVLVLLALDNIGVDVTALIAGLGIGGIAVALALQNVLGDLFASLAIALDRPFVIGDFVIIDDYLGTIENVGLKTTRIRSLGGEQLVFANSDLLNSRVRNFKRMQERRIVFHFGVLYDTPADTLEQIPRVCRTIVEQQEPVRFDRAHFKGFGDSSYDFEVVYWMLDPDFGKYMDTQQTINLALVRAFADMNVDFAYPTRTLHIASQPAPRSA
ncbi:MAG: mechanosensitive ion channel family protein [Oceanococcaceae bacterium]